MHPTPQFGTRRSGKLSRVASLLSVGALLAGGLAAVDLVQSAAPAAAIGTGGTVTKITIAGVRYAVHTFTTGGTLSLPVGASTTVDYLVVGGGAGGGVPTSVGGSRTGMGGGGAGGVRSGSQAAVPGGDYTVTVGAGGAAGVNGGNSTLNGNAAFAAVTATGGGKGASRNSVAGSGGSGGGGSNCAAAGTGIAGQGFNGSGFNRPIGTTASQCVAGQAGGASGGGGGGAGAYGVPGNTGGQGQAGGVGVTSSITGAPVMYSCGGGGGSGGSGATGGGSYNGGPGGCASAGRGAYFSGTSAAFSATANSGSGGGGGTYGGGPIAAGAGGSGVVVVRYPIFNVTYDGNGNQAGTPAPGVNDLVSGQAFTAAASGTLTKPGYQLTGWATGSDGSGQTCPPAGPCSITATADTVLYAQWAPIEYEVRFNVNGGAGALANQPFVYDVSQPLSATTFTRAGYSFTGWDTVATGGGTQFADQQSVSNLTTVDGSSVDLYAQWAGNPYTVAYDANTGTGAIPNQSRTVGDGVPLTSATFTKTGYAFQGWNTLADGTGTAYTNAQVADLTLVSGATVRLFAQWAPVNYQVRFNLNAASGGSGSMTNQPFVFDASQPLTANAFARVGYTFDRWTTAADGTGSQYTDQQSVQNLAVTDGAVAQLYAKWAPVAYTVVFNNNGGAGSLPNQARTFDDGVALRTNTFTRAGYQFADWNTLPTGGGLAYTNAQVANLSATAGATVTLYAQWTTNQYQVRFNANSGSGAMPNEAFTFDTPQALNANTFVKTGWSFAHWNTAADDSGTSFTNQQTVTNLSPLQGAVVDLYAVWNINRYTVAFNSNGGTGSMATQPRTYDDGVQLTANTFTKTGSTFLGWSTRADGAGSPYTDRQVANLTAADGVTVTLYAQWSSNSYRVTFNANGGSGTMSNQNFTYGTPQNLTPNSLTRNGYSFLRWASAANGSAPTYTDGQQVNNLTATPNGVVTLFAVWGPIGYQVAFDANTGSGAMPNQARQFDDGRSLSANSFTKPGYDFTGWNRAQNGTSVAYADEASGNLSSGEAAIITLFAQWSPRSYTVTFDNNGGSGTMANQSRVFDDGVALPSNSFSRLGAQFAGWNTQADGLGTAYADAQVANLTTAGGAITLYAQWAPNDYQVRFNASGGSGTMANESFVYGTPANLTRNAFTNTGHTFVEWATNADGTGTTYTDGELVSNLTATDGGVVDLYAVWAPISYTVVFDSNGGTGAMPNQARTFGDGVALSANAFTKVGSNFGGWNTQPDGSGDFHSDQHVEDLATTANATVTLYAMWGNVTYEVRFHPTAGTGTMADEQLRYDVPQALTLNHFERAGYHFDGWASAADGSAPLYTDGQTVSNLSAVQDSVVDLYARWAPNEYTTQFDANTGSGTMPTQVRTVDDGAQIDGNVFTRVGYTFAGWNTVADGSGVSYSDQAAGDVSLNDGATTTLYAQWQPTSYAVTFASNGGDGSMSDQSFTYDQSESLTPNAFTRTGYVFDGWTQGATTRHQGGALVLNLSTDGSTVTLTASWRPIGYRVAFEGNGAPDSMPDQLRAYDDGLELPAATFVRTGYVFTGWNTAQDGSGQSVGERDVANLSDSDGSTVILHAQWSAVPYTVNFVLNAPAGTGTMAPQAFVYDAPQDLTANSFERVGYRFAAWNTQPDGSGVRYVDQQQVNNLTAVGGAVDLYAIWLPVEYTTTFDPNGASGLTPPQSRSFDDGAPIADPSYSRPGYHLVEWNTAADGSGTAYRPGDVANLTDVQDASVELHAIWQVNQYQVRFDPNGGSAAMPNQDFAFGAPETLSPNAFQRAGYTFVTWTTNADGTGTSYLDAQDVLNLSVEHGVTVRLFAQWAPVSQPPATEPPATEPPATQPPVSQPPATVPPAPAVQGGLPATGFGLAAPLVLALVLLALGAFLLVAAGRRRRGSISARG